jgi:uncharacterized RDD family membrane protein YckC
MWYYTEGKQQIGPIDDDVINELISENKINAETLVWSSGMKNWQAAGTTSLATMFIVPDQIAPPGLQPLTQQFAGFWKRFAAYLIDTIILGICGGIIGGVIGAIIGFVMGSMRMDMNSITTVSGVIGFIIGLCLNWLYFTILESSTRQSTFGKLALGIIVTDLQGNRISFGRANGRYWSKYISSLILMIGYIMAAFTEKKQALHDSIAGTLVVNK